MLPTERPLSPHHLVAPTPPARPQETTPPTRQTPAPVTVPVSNAATARSVHAKPLIHEGAVLAVAHDQTGNAAVAEAMTRATGAVPPVLVRSMKPRQKDTPGR